LFIFYFFIPPYRIRRDEKIKCAHCKGTVGGSRKSIKRELKCAQVVINPGKNRKKYEEN
jgi:hypothetical protein